MKLPFTNQLFSCPGLNLHKIDRKGPKRALWNGGNSLYLEWSPGYTSIYILLRVQIAHSKLVHLLHISLISKN